MQREKVPPVAPTVGRRRTRHGVVLTGVLMGSPFAALAVAAVGGFHPGVPLVLSILPSLAGFLLLSEAHMGRAPLRVTGDRLTARTLTGARTVDLSAIDRVRLLTNFSPGGVSDRVVLIRDRHGVRLGLREPADRRRLRRALERRSTHGEQPRVSRAVRAHLGMPGSAGLGRHTVLSWLATVLGFCGYLGVVAVLTEQVAG